MFRNVPLKIKAGDCPEFWHLPALTCLRFPWRHAGLFLVSWCYFQAWLFKSDYDLWLLLSSHTFCPASVCLTLVTDVFKCDIASSCWKEISGSWAGFLWTSWLDKRTFLFERLQTANCFPFLVTGYLLLAKALRTYAPNPFITSSLAFLPNKDSERWFIFLARQLLAFWWCQGMNN